MTAVNLTALTVTGNTALNIDTALSSSVSTVDASGLTPLITPTAAGEGGLTVTLGTGANQTTTVTGSDGNDVIVSVAGHDTINSGAGADGVSIGAGEDTVDLGTGNDTLIVGAAGDLTTKDTADGGDGTDTIRVTGAETFVDADFTNLSNFEAIDIQGAVSVNFNLGSEAAGAFTSGEIDITNTTNNATVTNINGASLASGQTIDVKLGTNDIDDIIVGGAGADKINGANGVDDLTGGGGADRFEILNRGEANVGIAAADTTNANMDAVTDYVAGVDKFVFGTNGVFGAGGGAVTFTSATTVNVNTTVALGATADIAAIQTGVGAGQLGTSTAATAQAVVVTATGAMAGTYLIVDSGATAGYQATEDAIINITGLTGTISSGDFAFETL